MTGNRSNIGTSLKGLICFKYYNAQIRTLETLTSAKEISMTLQGIIQLTHLRQPDHEK